MSVEPEGATYRRGDIFKSAVVGSDEVQVKYQRAHRLRDHFRGPRFYEIVMTREEWDARSENQPSWQEKDRARLHTTLRRLDTLHQPYLGGAFGQRRDGERFWCQACRQPYPCASASLLLSYGNGEDVAEWKPVQLLAAEMVERDVVEPR